MEEKVKIINNSSNYGTDKPHLNKERVEILQSQSLYDSRKPYMNKEKVEVFKYPCVYTTHLNGIIKCLYSNTNTKGHFGIPKVICSVGTTLPIIDIDGIYGLTQFSFGIVDKQENLPFIQKAMLNPDFIKLMSYCPGWCKDTYNHRVIGLFRKDWWKEYQY
jgi:hypothetical protein